MPRRWGPYSPEYARDYEPGPAQFQRFHASDAERRLQVRQLARTRRTQDSLRADRARARSALNARALFESLNKNLAGLSEALAEFEKRKRLIGAESATRRKNDDET